ncbi:ABC transporter ATP-binding protein [Phytohabitans sp. ZYX-F-186]|uniref:ABC transporter ATP-binding protein n=1 Tax=Phytohabitans maris TaxID=3071409 RepID=A0ABU0ZPF5_9ACTN|nr:ABC transporter ATP-binding protein [Phytohabitans sp. ZYX-F-186]MDQ7908907.1 ABC transporter ATP-binding protein [Phytohabitans sp. ZYX-F-186]
MNTPPAPLVDLGNLRVTFRLSDRTVPAVRGVSLTVGEGEAVGILGESGSGKSVTGRTLLGLLRTPPARIEVDHLRFRGEDLSAAVTRPGFSGQATKRFAMVFQNPFTALNPVFRIGTTLCEVLVKRRGMSRADARRAAVDLLDAVHISDAGNRLRSYPHEFSGGMQQRIMIALALALEPEVLIADEPTTALDVTVQARILDLLREIQRERRMGMIFISHDLDVVSEVVSRVYVMYAGRIVETGPVDELSRRPRHPYTQGLWASAPRLDRYKTRLPAIPGNPPAPGHAPPGCAFHPRCRLATDICAQERPEPRPVADGALVACHHLDRAAQERETV